MSASKRLLAAWYKVPSCGTAPHEPLLPHDTGYVREGLATLRSSSSAVPLCSPRRDSFVGGDRVYAAAGYHIQYHMGYARTGRRLNAARTRGLSKNRDVRRGDGGVGWCEHSAGRSGTRSGRRSALCHVHSGCSQPARTHRRSAASFPASGASTYTPSSATRATGRLGVQIGLEYLGVIASAIHLGGVACTRFPIQIISKRRLYAILGSRTWRNAKPGCRQADNQVDTLGTHL